ncbi:MAG: hypothetical protein MUE72_02220, partial [Chitinophagaceae bacterium]|nr:hypothetical protein [Chitinophagaceae bacterium]
MKTKTIIVGIPESKGKNAIKKKTSTEFKSQFKFENFIQDDFEAELFALLTKQENKHYGGGVISFIHAFRTLFKTLKISSNLKTFIANFKGRYEYIYNTSRYSIAEKIFFIRVYKEYL